MTLLMVIAGAAVGAPSRYACDRLIQRWRGSVFPWGTLAVNTAGCFLLGVLSESTLNAHGLALLGTGFCGAFTTYSTFAYETAGLTRAGSWLPALLNIGASVAAGIGALALGVILGGWVA